MIIEIKLNKPFYFPHQTVEGSVLVFCEYPILIKSLGVRFSRRIKLNLKNIDGSTEPIVNTEKTAASTNFVLCENTELETGCNVFPFSFNISVQEKETGAAKCYFYDSMCVIERTLLVESVCEVFETGKPVEALMNTPNIQQIQQLHEPEKSEYALLPANIKLIKAEKHISVLRNQQNSSYIDTMIKMSSFICLYQRKLQFRIQFDKEWYFKGDSVNITFQPVNKVDIPMVSAISANLYQVVYFRTEKLNTMKCKWITSFDANPLKKNKFNLQFRMPMSIAPSIAENEFTVQCLLVFHVSLYNGKQLKIKKIVNTGETHFEIPKKELPFSEKNNMFVKKHLDYKID